MRPILFCLFLLSSALSFSQCGGYTLGITTMNPTCYGFCDGSVTAITSGGNGGDVFEITDSNASLVNVISDGTPNILCAGWYYIEVVDDSGCVLMDSVLLEEQSNMSFIEIGSEPAQCRTHSWQSGNGVVYAAVAGGIPDYTFYWNDMQTGANVNGSTWGGLNPGDYQITVWDDFGCSISEIVQVDSINPEAAFTIQSDDLNSSMAGYAPVSIEVHNDMPNIASPWPGLDTLCYWKIGNFAPFEPSTDVNEIKYETFYFGAWHGITQVAINKNGCTDSLWKFIFVLGILEDEIAEPSHCIISNSNNSIHIQSDFQSPHFAEIFSVSGQLIKKEELIAGTNVVPLPNGQYLVRIVDNQGVQVSEAQKIIIFN